MQKKTFSISYKWAMLLGLMIFALLLVGLVINKLFFYSYYLDKEKEAIYTFAQELDAVYDDDDLAGDLIESFILKKQALVNPINPDEHHVFSFGMMNSEFRGRSSKSGMNIALPHGFEEVLSEKGHLFFNFEHTQLRTNLLALVYQMNNGETLLVALPYEGIDTTANIAIEFNVIIALFLIAIGMVVVLILSRRMTKPIIQLSDMTRKIADLDFSESFKSKSNDEIGLLGDNINEMSTALEGALVNLKDANAQLLVDLQEKEKIVEMRKSLIANISHELKTPIALIMSYSEGLRENTTLDYDKKDYYLNVISKEAGHMDHLVRDLLDLTELEFDAFKMTQSSLDFSSLIDEVFDRYILMVSRKKLKINMMKADIIMMTGDKKRLEQAVTNLVVNALEYAEEMGTITIEVVETSTTIKFKISNSGSHILEADLENIWTSFYKAQDQKDRRIGGSGIGLSIVRAIIEKHKGTYGAYNEDNQVTFWFEIEK